MDEAVKGSIRSNLSKSGEICLAGSRLLVQESIYKQFLEKFTAEVGNIKVGDPLSEETNMGALVLQSHLETVDEYVRIGLAEGAKLACGGKRVEGLETGNFFMSRLFFTT